MEQILTGWNKYNATDNVSEHNGYKSEMTSQSAGIVSGRLVQTLNELKYAI